MLGLTLAFEENRGHLQMTDTMFLRSMKRCELKIKFWVLGNQVTVYASLFQNYCSIKTN